MKASIGQSWGIEIVKRFDAKVMPRKNAFSLRFQNSYIQDISRNLYKLDTIFRKTVSYLIQERIIEILFSSNSLFEID